MTNPNPNPSASGINSAKSRRNPGHPPYRSFAPSTQCCEPETKHARPRIHLILPLASYLLASNGRRLNKSSYCIAVDMAFINPLDKYRLSSSPPQPPRPPSTSTRSARPAAYPRSLSPSLSLSLSPASWEHHHPKAATTTPVQRQQRQRRARRGSESVSPSRRRVTRSQSRELEAGRGDEAEQLAAAARRGKARAEQSRG